LHSFIFIIYLDTIFQRTSKIPVPKKNKKDPNEKEMVKKFTSKSNENSRKSSITPRSSPSTQTDEFYLPRDGSLSLNRHNQHLASDILLKSINEIYFNNSSNRVKLLDHATTSGLVGKGLLFNHFDSTELDDFELNDENLNDEFISNFNNSNLIRNNKLFNESMSNSEFNLDKLLLDDFRKRLSQINEESSDRSSLLSRTKWSSSISELSNSDLNNNNSNNNNQGMSNKNNNFPIASINKNNNNNNKNKITNKTTSDVFGRPIHRQVNRTYTKLI